MNSFTLEELRLQLEEKDRELVRLLNERASLAELIGRVKEALSRKPYDPAQEAKVLRRIQEINKGPLPDHALKDIFREILSSCRAIQGPTRVAFLGPEGSFSHQAAICRFGRSAEFFALPTIKEVFFVAEKGQAHWAVVPVENSAEGSIKATLDGLVSTPLKVCGEVILRINHCLLSRSSSLGDIKRIYSHPQGLAQCMQWLREHLPGRELIEVSSTSQGALRATEDPQGAAVGSELAAELYNLAVVAKGIQDTPTNSTRFLVLGQGEPGPTGRDKTSVLFATRHIPGALCRSLVPLAEEQVNLLRLESYPMRDRPWEYLFFADLEGHAWVDPLNRAMARMQQTVTFFRTLGSYPQGEA